MIAPLITPAEKASMKEAALREMQAEAARRRMAAVIEQGKLDAERREILDRQTVCFREAFDASAKNLAEEIGIEPGQVASVLASIVAGQVPNFRCTFDDDL